MACGKNILNSMINNLLRANILFFDSNPSGRILTRFSKDISVVNF